MPVLKDLRARVAAGDLESDPAQEVAAARLSRLVDDLRGWRPGLKAHVFGRYGPGVCGLYLHGDVGRGKSMLMDLFFDIAPTTKKRRVHFHAFMLEVHARMKELRAGGGGDPLPKAAKAIASDAWLLCFDEFQVTDIGDAMILGRLFEALFGHGVTVVATSNRRPHDLYKDGINRQLFLPFIDLLRANVELVELDGDQDYRLAGLSGAPVWLTPLDDTSQTAFDDAWARIVAGAPVRPETLHVGGRPLALTHAAPSAVRVTFDELCARPLGAADYIALAQRFATIAMDGVPTLTADKRDQAKRFVVLIDTLYETKTKLLARAAAAPDALYPEGDGAFEFQRTASRLHEMQTHAYLSAARVFA